MLSHYIIVRGDLSPGEQLAYVVHAAGESISNRVPTGTRAVVLGVPKAQDLEELSASLDTAKLEHTLIREDGVAYSLGIAPRSDGRIRRVTSDLKLAG